MKILGIWGLLLSVLFGVQCNVRSNDESNTVKQNNDRGLVNIWNKRITNSTKLPLPGRVSGIAISDEGVFYTYDDQVIWVSENKGVKWRPILELEKHKEVAARLGIIKKVEVDESRIWVLGDSLEYSDDKGLSWIPSRVPSSILIRSFSIKDGNGLVVGETLNGGSYPGSQAVIYQSEKNSRNWKLANLPKGSGKLYATDCNGNGFCLAVGETIIRSFDFGKSWQDVSSEENNKVHYFGELSSVEFQNNETAWIFSNQGAKFVGIFENGRLFRTYSLPSPLPISAFQTLKGEILALSTDGLWLSAKGTDKWSRLKIGEEITNFGWRKSADSLFLVGAHNLYEVNTEIN